MPTQQKISSLSHESPPDSKGPPIYLDEGESSNEGKRQKHVIGS